MKKHIVKIVLVVVIVLGIYYAYDFYDKQYKESYTYMIEKEGELVAHLHLTYMNNGGISKIRIYTMMRLYPMLIWMN